MNKGLFFLKCVVIAIIGVAVLGWVTMSLWNWLIPELFHGPLINYWQALGLFILSKILFGSWGARNTIMAMPKAADRHTGSIVFTRSSLP